MPTSSPSAAAATDPQGRSRAGGGQNARRPTSERLVLSGFVALALILLASCDRSTAMEAEEFCAVPRVDTLSQGPTRSFPDLSPRTAVLVVEESTAPGCQPWDWDGDHTACINATLDVAYNSGTTLVGLTRGRQYRYSDRIIVPPNTVLGAVGDPTRDRPILATSVLVPEGIAITSGAEIRNLDIRGPHYNTTKFPVKKHGDWAYKGINGATHSRWTILGTRVNGFTGTGILAAMSNDIRIEGNTVSHNGYSGVSLFQGGDDCGQGVRFVGNLVEHNGQDGIDTCASDALYANNIVRHNGWDQNGGDRNGLLVFAWSKGGAARIQITDNLFYGNGESGIRISGNPVTDIVVTGNHMSGNGHWGLDPGDSNGILADVDVQDNACGRNHYGCLNKEFLRGVTVSMNACFR